MVDFVVIAAELALETGVALRVAADMLHECVERSISIAYDSDHPFAVRAREITSMLDGATPAAVARAILQPSIGERLPTGKLRSSNLQEGGIESGALQVSHAVESAEVEDLLCEGPMRRNRYPIRCKYCKQSTVLAAGSARRVVKWAPVMMPAVLLKSSPGAGRDMPPNVACLDEEQGALDFWQVSTVYDFENVGVSNDVPGSHGIRDLHVVKPVKFLTCADCDVGPIGAILPGSAPGDAVVNSGGGAASPDEYLIAVCRVNSGPG